MRPQDLPELRHQVIDGWETHMAFLMNKDPKDWETLNFSLQPWKLGELFFVTSDMAQLAYAAAKPLPDYDLRREDLPSEFGIIYFDTPISDDPEMPITCVAWRQTNASTNIAGKPVPAGVELDFWGPADLPAPYTPLAWSETAIVPYDGGEPVVGLNRAKEGLTFWAHVVRCSWLLMQQRVARVDEYLPDRASARRLARAGRGVTPVRVISLRQPEVHGGPGSDRTYHHRWVVRGHWRKQWYPSQQRNVPLWITPYVKGPDGAPLLAGEKVYAWQR
jgi:hypothetical protein